MPGWGSTGQQVPLNQSDSGSWLGPPWESGPLALQPEVSPRPCVSLWPHCFIHSFIQQALTDQMSAKIRHAPGPEKLGRSLHRITPPPSAYHPSVSDEAPWLAKHQCKEKWHQVSCASYPDSAEQLTREEIDFFTRSSFSSISLPLSSTQFLIKFTCTKKLLGPLEMAARK